MSDQPFRFLHSADFQLDQPLHGLTEIPDHLRDVLIDGSYRAAQRVFDTAVSEKVAFICLSGNLLNLLVPTARSLSFLHEQFGRLADLGIAVYWTGGHQDAPRHWPAAIPLPDSVHHFDAADVATRTHEDASGFVVQIVGHGHADQSPAAFRATPASGQFTIAVVTGATDSRLLAARGVNYWALGGQDDRKTLFTEPNIAHYPGTPQGRSPSNIGPHGCTLVEVRSLQEARLRFIPCDVVRWQHERVLVSAAATWNDLQELLSQRVQEMRSQTPTLPLFVRWTLAAADGAVDADVVRGMAGRIIGLAEETIRLSGGGVLARLGERGRAAADTTVFL